MKRLLELLLIPGLFELVMTVVLGMVVVWGWGVLGGLNNKKQMISNQVVFILNINKEPLA